MKRAGVRWGGHEEVREGVKSNQTIGDNKNEGKVAAEKWDKKCFFKDKVL